MKWKAVLLLVIAIAVFLAISYIPILGDIIRLWDPEWITQEWGKGWREQ